MQPPKYVEYGKYSAHRTFHPTEEKKYIITQKVERHSVPCKHIHNQTPIILNILQHEYKRLNELHAKGTYWKQHLYP